MRDANPTPPVPRPETPAPDDVLIDEASEESFPASDPPSTTPLHTGAPSDHPDPPRQRPDAPDAHA